MAFWKWALTEIGGFDPIFHQAGDDVDLCWRLQQARHRIGFSPAAFVWHHRRSTIRAYLKQQHGYGEAEALLVLKGRLGLLLFDQTGRLLGKRLLEAGGDCVGVDLPPGEFHALVVLEPDSILFEAKAGPYRPVGAGEQADWAPREGEPGVADYLAWMRAQFD